MIDGVKVKQLKCNLDDRGILTELLRVDDDIYEGFGQLTVTTINPGVVKAWHRHQLQTDVVACVKGNVKVGIVNDRDTSGGVVEINEFFLGENNPIAVKIPPRLWHGYMALGNEKCTIVYVTTKAYNRNEPDEERKEWNTFGDIWSVKNR